MERISNVKRRRRRRALSSGRHPRTRRPARERAVAPQLDNWAGPPPLLPTTIRRRVTGPPVDEPGDEPPPSPDEIHHHNWAALRSRRCPPRTSRSSCARPFPGRPRRKMFYLFQKRSPSWSSSASLSSSSSSLASVQHSRASSGSRRATFCPSARRGHALCLLKMPVTFARSHWRRRRRRSSTKLGDQVGWTGARQTGFKFRSRQSLQWPSTVTTTPTTTRRQREQENNLTAEV